MVGMKTWQVSRWYINNQCIGLTRYVFNGPLYISEMNISMAKHVAMITPKATAATSANGTWSSCVCSRLVAGYTPRISPVVSSRTSLSGLNSRLFSRKTETPLDCHRQLRSSSWCFQYSMKTIHHRAFPTV